MADRHDAPAAEAPPSGFRPGHRLRDGVRKRRLQDWHCRVRPRGPALRAGGGRGCSLFVTLSGRVKAPCSSEQRGVIVCMGSVVMSLTVCPDYVVSGVLAQGILPFAVIAGFFGLFCLVLLFGVGSPHLPAGLSTVMAAAELPAGLLIAMIVLGEPLGVVEWLGVAIILAGVCLAQAPSLLGGREARRAAAGQAVS